MLMNFSLFLNTILFEAIHTFQKYTITKGTVIVFIFAERKACSFAVFNIFTGTIVCNVFLLFLNKNIL